jgi:hypothetical protein
MSSLFLYPICLITMRIIDSKVEMILDIIFYFALIVCNVMLVKSQKKREESNALPSPFS